MDSSTTIRPAALVADCREHKPTAAPNVVATACAWLMGCIFLWAAVSKSVAPQDAAKFVFFTLPAAPPLLVVMLVALSEWMLGTALMLGWRRTLALWLAVAALSVLTTVLVYARLSGFTGGCGCLGIQATLPAAIARNAILIVACCIGLYAESREPLTAQRSIR